MTASILDAGFPRSKRLLRGHQFRRVFQRPTRSADAFFTVAACCPWADATADQVARLGLAVSRKALPRAVDRNRIKRIVRDAFRQRPWDCPVDIVVVGRSGLRGKPNSDVRGSIEAHFDRIVLRLCSGGKVPTPTR